MRHIVAVSLVAALAIALAAFTTDAGQRKGGTGDRVQQVEQERMQDQDRLRSRHETRDYAKLRDEEIYGHELMSKEELNQYRRQMSMMKTAKAREQFQVQHEDQMRERAMHQNKDIVPPGQGPVYRGELMSVQERNEYREQLRHIESEQERDRFIARHREKMDERARALAEESEEAE